MSVNPEPTFVFHNSKVYAFENGKIVASGTDIEEVERIIEASSVCPSCGSKSGSCSDCAPPKRKTTHVVTPNGLKGQILGRHRDVWGDQVTVRFENGRIASFAVTSDLEMVDEAAPEKANPIEELKARLDAEFDPDKDGLVARTQDLKKLRQDAANLVTSGVSQLDQTRLDEIIVTADYERGEIADALEHMNVEEAFIPEAPFEPRAVEQESLGGDGSWVDAVAEQMISENEGRDFDELMDEGPELFVADLENPALADAGTTREMALSFVQSRTAGIESGAKSDFEKTFLTRVEQVRRRELLRRKGSARKEAKVKQERTDGPSEQLFM